MAGLRMTLLLGISTILASLVIGAVGALLQSGPSRVLRALVNGFVVVFRNTPPLVQILSRRPRPYGALARALGRPDPAAARDELARDAANTVLAEKGEVFAPEDDA
ncbi:hypothetical protein [Methylobacterium oryzae]|uniref:hypothetical protein n=1 Tax=Methylobacterium oryzae TaxID=334852 RepID=UPI002F359139